MKIQATFLAIGIAIVAWSLTPMASALGNTYSMTSTINGSNDSQNLGQYNNASIPSSISQYTPPVPIHHPVVVHPTPVPVHRHITSNTTNDGNSTVSGNDTIVNGRTTPTQ